MCLFILHFFLLFLSLNNECFFSFDPRPSAYIERNDKEKRKHKEDDTPDNSITLESSSKDPIEEANHNAKNSSNTSNYEESIKNSLTTSKRIVVLRNTRESRFESTHCFTIFVAFKLVHELSLGELKFHCVHRN